MSEEQEKPTTSKADGQEGDEALSALYRQLPDEPVPEQLDQLILGAAKAEAEHMQSSTVLETEGRFSRRNSRLRYMASLAASFLVGVVAVQLYMQTEEISDSVQSMPLPEISQPAPMNAPSPAAESYRKEADSSFADFAVEEAVMEREVAEGEAPAIGGTQDGAIGLGVSPQEATAVTREASGMSRSEVSAFSSAPASPPAKPKAFPAKKLKAKPAPEPIVEKKSTRKLAPSFDAGSSEMQKFESEVRIEKAAEVESRSTRQMFNRKQESMSKDAMGIVAPADAVISTVPEYRQTKEKWTAHIKMLIQHGKLAEAEEEILAYRKMHGEFPE